jgi:orotate phosphoribosyltransferase
MGIIGLHESDRKRLLHLIKTYSYQECDVTLASGKKSHFYVDCKQTACLGEGASIIGRLFYSHLVLLEKNGISYDACGGMALGAVPLAIAVSMTAFLLGRELPSLVVRKEVKNHGTGVFVEGANSVSQNGRVLLLEDVVTTGWSTILAAQRLRDAGYKVDMVFALVNREAGVEKNFKDNGLFLCSLFDLTDFPSTKMLHEERICDG